LKITNVIGVSLAGIEKIKKRDGKIVDFDEGKIAEAIWKAASSLGGKDRSLSLKLADQVVGKLENQLKPGEVPSVEQVQDLVEKTLIENGHARTAKAYILYRHKRAEIRRMKLLLGVVDELKLPLNAISPGKTVSAQRREREGDRVHR
jgi:anaerobic ribonucleoside-triphosphate reductase